MKARTSLTAPGSALHPFTAILPGQLSRPVQILAEDHLDAIAQVYRLHSPTAPWRLYLVLGGVRVGEWALEPVQGKAEPPRWPSSLSSTVRAEVVRP